MGSVGVEVYDMLCCNLRVTVDGEVVVPLPRITSTPAYRTSARAVASDTHVISRWEGMVE